MRANPPRLAAALLDRLGPTDTALEGDLKEEYAAGRGPIWYWYQVLVAIVLTGGRDLAQHKRLALRALLVGCGAAWLGLVLVGQPLSNVMRMFIMRPLLSGTWTEFLRSFPAFTVLWVIDLAAYVPLAASYLWSGWIVGRVYKGHTGAVLVFAGLVLVHALVQTTLWVRLPRPTHFPYPVAFVVTYTWLPTFFTVIGGVWGLGRRGGATVR